MPDTHFRLIRRKLFWTTMFLSAAVIASFTLTAYSFKSNHDSATRERRLICDAQNNSNNAVRRVLLLAQQIAKTRKDRTPEERAAAADFYKRALRLVGPVPCQGSN